MSAKRPSKFEAGTNSKAPSDFKVKPVNRESFIETARVVPPKAEGQIVLDGISPRADKIDISTLPSNYRDSFYVPEPIVEKKEFVYEIPKGFEHFKSKLTEKKEPTGYVEELEVRLDTTGEKSWEGIDKIMRAICKTHGISPKKLHDEFKEKHGQIPDVWVRRNEEPVVEDTRTPMQVLADSIPLSHKKNIDSTPVNEEFNNRLLFLERQVISLKQVSIENQQGTIVHALGHESPGSGEVNLSKMDDVAMDAVQDGDHLIWDSTLGKWIPSGAVDGGTGTNGSILLRLFLLEEKLHSIEEILHEHVDEGGDHENHVGEMVEYESGTDRTLAQAVNFTDHTKAYIALEEALQGDHFHFAAPLTDLIIRVEDGTQFIIPTPEDHLPVLVEPEINSDYYGVARPIDFQDANLKLLAFEESNQHQVFAAEGDLIFELEDNTPLFLPTGELYGFSVDDGTDLTNSNAIDWGSDVTLLNQEGAHFSPSVLEPQEGNFVELEQTHTTTGYNYDPEAQYNFEKFFDFEADGDTTVFTVTQDTVRNVYQLDGIPQPTVQLPRGDIIGFDVRNLEDKDSFTIFADGEEVSEPAVVRHLQDNVVMVYTGLLGTNISKMYYRHRTIRGLGWVIVITDN